MITNENRREGLCRKILESGCLRMQPKMGGKSHLKLNIGKRPIVNKYREGKMKRTLKRELKVLEIVNREPLKFFSIHLIKSTQSEWSLLDSK